VRAEGLLKSAGESEIGACVSQASSVTSLLFGHLPTQHPQYQSRHRRRQRRLHRSTPSPTEGGAAEIFFNSELVLQIRGSGLKWRRYITMPSSSFCPCNCCLAMSVDLADPHYRSICLGRPDEHDQPGNITSCCDSGLDPPPAQKSNHARSISTNDLWRCFNEIKRGLPI
jgi:hypothetical protein